MAIVAVVDNAEHVRAPSRGSSSSSHSDSRGDGKRF